VSKGNRKRRKQKGLLPTREKCVAHNRFGEPCGKYPVAGAVVCASHGGSAPQVRKKAQDRIMMAQDDAASTLVRFMGDDSVPYAERRRCAEFLLTYADRNKVEVTIAKWQEGLDGIFFDDGSPNSDDVVDAELVEERIPDDLPFYRRPLELPSDGPASRNR
jgi:hypothetical protein